MSIEELLLPRFKVIADYFYSPYKVGDIITVLYDGHTVHLTTTHYRDEFGEEIDQQNRFHPDRLQDYPQLFQPLPWWEERKPEDMPQFLKWINNKTVTRPKRYSDQFFYLEDDNSFGYFLGYTEPATEAEYTAYITQTQQP